MHHQQKVGSRRGIKLLLVGVLSWWAMLTWAADVWPSRPIKFIVPFGPGGANDVVARAFAEVASKQLGQPIIVENKPGAGSALGADLVAKSAPDGYTFLTPAAGVVTNGLIKAKMPYKDEELVPVALMAISPSVIIVPANSPVKDLKGFIAASKGGNGFNFATAGTGSTPHFVAEMLKLKYGAKLDIIPYKSGLDGVLAVISQQVEGTSEGSPVVLQHIKTGKVRALASTWNRRLPALPDLPTAKELGYPEIFIGHWSGVFAPRGTPDEIFEKMNRAIDAAAQSLELRSRFIPQAIDPIGGSRASFVQFINGERTRLGAIAKASGMKQD